MTEGDAVPVEEVTAKPRPAPVRPEERVAAVDLLRGVALLGILVMNIPTFVWPEFPENPMQSGHFTGLDRAIWFAQHIIFETKMMTLFSMLFGAGLVLMSDRAEDRGVPLAGRYYRRVLWLMAIGALHGYFVWTGDILFWYGACGLVLYPMRHWSPRLLIGLGLAMNVFIAVLGLLIAMGAYFARTTATEVARLEAAGGTADGFKKEVADAWDQFAPEVDPPREKTDAERAKTVAVYRGGYAGIVAHRAFEVLMLQTFGLVFMGFWLCGGRMMIGMGLMRLGVFTGSCTHRFYITMMILGYLLGLPLVFLDVWALVRDQFRFVSLVLSIGFLNHLGGLAVAMGHAALVMLAYKLQVLPRLQAALGAVGRMALTNYLTHSLVLSTLFYGYGFGLYDRVDRTQQMGIVLAIWSFQLIISPIWLRHFRFGPAEWVWRSLTYGAPQPMRVVPVD